ncbi:Dihydrolipoyllysine-residue succinyltransferase component of 2-oxoglutarate dehydrogenase complex [Candidatus Portiera aleyrodidarum]|uniref:Dihydrolipoyllysine-residue succinyltransferase n=2 Tax=Candidatus Portiera aleyrodidarum TaxID=91844 RepID=A0A6S6RYU2_9GAMM|nr:Dihydrolipoyllysine-residue succinyltransferase component of 2-oxoglutarate dehydrogenase complex [Candidatus Portiera aleyrodidarum]
MSPFEGILKEIKIQEGKPCKSEQLLGIIVVVDKGFNGSEVKKKVGQKIKIETEAEAEVKAKVKEDIYSPSVRKMMASKNIDVKAKAALSGTGGGCLLKEDVLRSIKEVGEKRVPLSRLRQTMAKRIVKAQKKAAMLTTFNEIDMNHIIEIRAQYRELFKKIHGTKLGLMGFFVKACTVALKHFKKVNAFIDAKEIIYHNYQDIGIAVSTKRGLVVPILRNTDSIKIEEIEKQIMDFRQRGINGKLTIKELTGGTFTITNGGIFGSLFSTPIINPPQTAILGMHKIQKRPVVLNGEIVIRPMMYLALSYDHRILDGKDAVQFLNLIKELLENPIRFILNI